jgi:isoamylase
MSSPPADATRAFRSGYVPATLPLAKAGRHAVERGTPLPLGLTRECGGVNLAVFSRHAARVTLLVYDELNVAEPSARIDLDPRLHRTGDVWHIRLNASLEAKGYALQVEGLALQLTPALVL